MRFRTKTALVLLAILSVALTFVIDAIAPTHADAAPTPAPTGTIGFDTAGQTVNEANGTVTLTLTRQGGSAGALEVGFSTADGTATDGDDYNGIGVPITITWPDGNTNNRTVTLPIIPDLITEPNETFTADLTATNPDWLGSHTTHTVTILGTGPAPTPTPTATPTPGPSATPTPGPSATPVPPTPPAPPGPALPPLPTPTPTPDPIAGPLVSGAISSEVQGDTVVLTVPAGLAVWLDPAETVTVRRNPVVFEGPLPASRTISFPLDGADQPFEVTFSSTLTNGAPYSEIVRVVPPQNESTLPLVPAIAPADGQPTPGTRILLDPATQTSAPTELAFTGSQTKTLVILTGFLLVSGAAFVACSRDIVSKSRFTF